MTDEFNAERAREATVNALEHAAMTVGVNAGRCLNILMEHLGAPDEAAARMVLEITGRLLLIMAQETREGIVRDASEKLNSLKTTHKVH